MKRIATRFEQSILTQLLCEIEMLDPTPIATLDKVSEFKTQSQRINYVEQLIKEADKD